jgi:hypothetical protein
MFKMNDPVIMPGGNTLGHIVELKETPAGPRVVVEYTSQAEYLPSQLRHADQGALERNRSLTAELEKSNSLARSLEETIKRNLENPPIAPSQVKQILREPAQATGRNPAPNKKTTKRKR